MASMIPVSAFAPDITDLGTNASNVVSGVVPSGSGYAAFKSYIGFTFALPANARGFFFARRSDGSISVFVGTATELYLLNNTTFLWDKVSKGGGPYGSLLVSTNWRFAQFNDFVLAAQINTVPQKYVLTSGGTFVDLGGTPPQAGQIAIVNRFVMLTELLSNPRRVQWSDLDAPETWTAGVGLADFQDLPDGGGTHAVSGGDAYGVVFQDEAIRTLTYAPGSSYTFQISRISTQDTLFAESSVINAGTRTFFISAQGFKVITAGGEPVPIGKNMVDEFFFADVDRSNLQLVIGAVDPQATRVYWAYKSQQGQTGLFDKILCFDWSLKERPWTLIPMSGQYLGYLAKPGLTLEQLDSIAPGGLQVLGAANNGSGLVRLTLNAISSPYYQIAGQNFIVVQGITPSYMNGQWKVNIIDSTHIDLIGSTYSTPWVSGGALGGSLDALPFSLDSISSSAIAQLSMVGPDMKLGFFTGPNIEAIVDTPEIDAEGSYLFVDNLTPMTDSPDVRCSIGYRDTAYGAIQFTAESAITSTGDCPLIIEGRYLKSRMRIPAGSVWKYIRGVRPSAQPAGDN